MNRRRKGNSMSFPLSQRDRDRLEAARELLRKDTTLERGLSDEEMARLEETYAFTFPPDHRYFLSLCLPTSPRFPNWREASNSLENQMAWPFEGIAFDIRHSSYWRREWGEKPTSIDDAISLAKEKCRGVPKLIPIYAHVYMPCHPCIAGNPVFSVYQTDVIHCGGSLADYIDWLCYGGDKEAIEDKYPIYSPSYRYIPFWTDLARENYSS